MQAMCTIQLAYFCLTKHTLENIYANCALFWAVSSERRSVRLRDLAENETGDLSEIFITNQVLLWQRYDSHVRELRAGKGIRNMHANQGVYHVGTNVITSAIRRPRLPPMYYWLSELQTEVQTLNLGELEPQRA